MHNNVLYSHHELLRFLNLARDTNNVGHESHADRSRTKEMKLPEKGEDYSKPSRETVVKRMYHGGTPTFYIDFTISTYCNQASHARVSNRIKTMTNLDCECFVDCSWHRWVGWGML